MPNAMLAATPPRRTTRSSTRNESDTLWSWSASSCWENRPGKCIKWSVAIEPLTRTGTAGTVPNPSTIPNSGASRKPRPVRTRLAAEGVTAGAAAACVRVVDGRADQVRRAHPVDDQRYTAPLDLDVTVEGALVEEQLVLQP